MAGGKCGYRRALFSEADRKSRITADYRILFYKRLCMHPDFLSIPDFRTKRSLLRELPNLRLGTFFHVHPNAFHSYFLQLVAVFHGGGGNHSLGIYVDEIP